MDQGKDNVRRLEWLEEFEELANLKLTEGSACTQIHPIVERWLDNLLEGDPPESRDAVWQAMSCLTTEIFLRLTPQSIVDVLEEHFEEDEISTWLESIVLIGRAFQIALDRGDLDDL